MTFSALIQMCICAGTIACFHRCPVFHTFLKQILCATWTWFIQGKEKGHKSRLYNLGPLSVINPITKRRGVHFKLHTNDKQNLFKKRKDEKHRNSNALWTYRHTNQFSNSSRWGATNSICASSSMHTLEKSIKLV